MTTPRYILERIARAFGYNRRTQRLSDAASEMHLLREAEAHLGKSIWQHIEPIEALSNEYWSLRKLTREHAELEKRIVECEQRLQQAQHERADLINGTSSDDGGQLVEERDRLLDELEELSKTRESISSEGRNIRRLYDGAKTKLEVLSLEDGTSEEELDKVRGRLEQLKDRFTELKNERDALTERIQQGDRQLDEINAKLATLSEQNREAAAEAFKVINAVNKEVWQLRAESGLLETRMHQLHAEIGRYVSRHAFHDAACRKAAASQRGLVEVMRALRRSIALNHRLAGTV